MSDNITTDRNGAAHDGKGLFATSRESEPDAGAFDRLTRVPEREPLVATFTLQAWVDDNAVDTGETAEFNLVTVLDALPLSEVLAHNEIGEWDFAYDSAVRSGLIENREGPYFASIDGELVAEYIAGREAHGQFDPITTTEPTLAEKRAKVGAALSAAHAEIPVAWVFSASDRSQQAAVRQAFLDAATKLEGVVSEDYDDQNAIGAIYRIVRGTDPRGGTFHDQATAASASLADWLLNRDDRFANDR